MDNEATKALFAPENNETLKDSAAEVVKEEKGTGFGARVVATAAGAALGTGAVNAGEHIYAAAMGDSEEENLETEENATAEEADAQVEEAAAEEVKPETQPEPQHTVVEHVVTVKVESPAAEVQTMVSNAQYVDNTPQSHPADTDNEVHVVGVAIQDNGQGGLATLAALQQGNDTAIVVDVDSDGEIDIVGVDQNHDGSFSENEIHDVSDQHMATADVVGAYVNEAHAHHEMATVTDLDTNEQYQITEVDGGYGLASIEQTASEPNPDLYTAYSEDMPDYMNDADTGIMEA